MKAFFSSRLVKSCIGLNYRRYFVPVKYTSDLVTFDGPATPIPTFRVLDEGGNIIAPKFAKKVFKVLKSI